MNAPTRRSAAAALATLLLGAPGVAAEVVEEVVAKVNDDIITKSDLENAESEQVAELYRKFSGEELDKKVVQARAGLLRSMIDQKVLFQHAARIFDLEKAGDAYLRSFKEQQKIKSDEDLSRVLAPENMTIADLKKRLLEMWAPEEVVRAEVFDRVAVGDKEVEESYRAHVDDYTTPAVANVREIVVLADDADRAAEGARAREVRERAAAPGADFAALAKELSESGTKDSGGILGPVKRGDLSSQLEEQAFSLPVGAVSEVLEAPYGFHILKVDSRTDVIVTPLDDVRETIRNRLAAEKKQTALDEFLEKLWAEATVEIMPQYKDRFSPR